MNSSDEITGTRSGQSSGEEEKTCGHLSCLAPSLPRPRHLKTMPVRPLKPQRLVAAAHQPSDQCQRYAVACLEYLRNEAQLAPNTIAAYTRDLKRFCEWAGDKQATKLGVTQLADYLAWLHKL